MFHRTECSLLSERHHMIQESSRSDQTHATPDTPRLKNLNYAGTHGFPEHPVESQPLKLLPLLRPARHDAGKLAPRLLRQSHLAITDNAAVPLLAEIRLGQLPVLSLSKPRPQPNPRTPLIHHGQKPPPSPTHPPPSPQTTLPLPPLHDQNMPTLPGCALSHPTSSPSPPPPAPHTPSPSPPTRGPPPTSFPRQNQNLATPLTITTVQSHHAPPSGSTNLRHLPAPLRRSERPLSSGGGGGGGGGGGCGCSRREEEGVQVGGGSERGEGGAEVVDGGEQRGVDAACGERG
ncbi:hypothetical protein CHGG_01649 [Chaetomium globosum CBS 148.51]|uniref:Uncharacterized protein n=1 Tax=Chaetomium globosum (strain ATCC 6205 / CBS 148.51 / DSM 1962 / NBRC 6347 / NRRL 1970) TaxID=306901 RepID=Q2HDQ5_CHAGB|nr:uncharacterized protein CHGG_01649 [Chaetomium globosum CBS 148.51]EAQ93414.1 hypothetical protein CHGG_01649 [Chaetomium globosum CBS 148.51]